MIEFPCPFSSEVATGITNRIYSSDGSTDLKETFKDSGEPWHPMISTAEETPHLSVYENWQLNREKYAVQDAWLKAWNETASKTSTGTPIDGLLLPPSAFVAHKHGQWPRLVPHLEQDSEC